MIRRLVLWLLSRYARRQERTQLGGVYCIDGQVVACHLCKQVIKYPPVRIPLGPPEAPVKDAVYSEEGYCLNPETPYGRFHLTCAIRTLMLLEATQLEAKPNMETKRDEPDSG